MKVKKEVGGLEGKADFIQASSSYSILLTEFPFNFFSIVRSRTKAKREATSNQTKQHKSFATKNDLPTYRKI
jgi:hypothetical protein